MSYAIIHSIKYTFRGLQRATELCAAQQGGDGDEHTHETAVDSGFAVCLHCRIGRAELLYVQ